MERARYGVGYALRSNGTYATHGTYGSNEFGDISPISRIGPICSQRRMPSLTRSATVPPPLVSGRVPLSPTRRFRRYAHARLISSRGR
jgi:hypothetical protein